MVEHTGRFGKAFRNCDFLECCGVDTFRLRAQRWVSAADSRKASSAAETDLEASICETTHQSVDGSDRKTICQHPRDPSAHSEIFFSIEQCICELSHSCVDSRTKSFHCVLTDIVACKESYDGRNQDRVERFLTNK